jgi:hypothetical protein
MSTTHKCPKCGRPAEQAGEATVNGGPPLPVYQCETCVERVDFGGETIDAAFTFAIDKDGRVIDPAA